MAENQYDVKTWPKYRQYAWAMSIIWGKMCSTIDAARLAARCPDIYQKTGVVCPLFTEADLEPMLRMYMSLYPEHRGFEDRFRWIVRCIFSGGQVPATPPNVLTLAPYLPQRKFPASVAPGTVTILPVTEPPPDQPSGSDSDGFLAEIPSWAKYVAAGVVIYYLLRGR